MTLQSLIENLEIIDKINYENIDVDTITCDSREIFDKCLFFAVKGNNLDGNDFVKCAIKRGANVIVSETPSNEKVCQIIVKDVREAMAKIAYNFYKPNGNRVKVIGVVGTNGKTTTTFIIKKILETAGYKAGIIGTLGAFYDKAIVAPELTTPDSISFFEILKNMADKGVEYAVVELSAHAITQKRVGNLTFEALVFTNCTQDHLDYYKDFKEYEETKMSVFTNEKCRFSVVNADDATGIKIINKQNLKVFSYGLDNPSDVFAVNLKSTINGNNFFINIFDEIENVNYLTPGKFNVYNCLAAATVTALLGIDSKTIAKAISRCKYVPGRLEFIENYNGANVFIDYAHTPDGLENLLKSLKAITENKLYIVFGCGGNRDKSKREIMGKIAGEYADYSVITTDNPRFEEAYQIISEIEKGIRSVTNRYITIQNRSMAIGYALTKLKQGDTLVIAGKGAEEYQDVMGVKLKFSDKEQVRDIIAKLNLSGELI